MPTVLLVFEFLGTTELMVIALVALIIFGPRKLPEIGRKLGRGMAEFKRASEDFKRTWEYEVEVERRQEAAPRVEQETAAARTSLLEEGSRGETAEDIFNGQAVHPAAEPDDAQTIPRTPPGATAPPEAEADTAAAPAHEEPEADAREPTA
ncbi:MAG TPA: twin-arginine translocase TatA/TatE family subunit [Pyrinomonadaceae bacterium]|nr:twin-arginine translocase TatA/TatE family subunit [Pyrinomonadaceae bacterium]